MAVKTSSAKARARKQQNAVREAILRAFPHLDPDDVQVRSMGAAGEDLMLSPRARESLPVSIECKATQGAPAIAALRQSKANAGAHLPVVIWRPKGARKMVVSIELEDFLGFVAERA